LSEKRPVTVTLGSKFAIKRSLQIQTHFKGVVTLPSGGGSYFKVAGHVERGRPENRGAEGGGVWCREGVSLPAAGEGSGDGAMPLPRKF